MTHSFYASRAYENDVPTGCIDSAVFSRFSAGSTARFKHYSTCQKRLWRGLKTRLRCADGTSRNYANNVLFCLCATPLRQSRTTITALPISAPTSTQQSQVACLTFSAAPWHIVPAHHWRVHQSANRTSTWRHAGAVKPGRHRTSRSRPHHAIARRSWRQHPTSAPAPVASMAPCSPTARALVASALPAPHPLPETADHQALPGMPGTATRTTCCAAPAITPHVLAAAPTRIPATQPLAARRRHSSSPFSVKADTDRASRHPQTGVHFSCRDSDRLRSARETLGRTISGDLLPPNHRVPARQRAPPVIVPSAPAGRSLSRQGSA